MKRQILSRLPQLALSGQNILLLSGFAAVILFLALCIWGDDGLLKLWQLKQLHSQIAAENRELLMQNLSFTQKIQSLKNPNQIENFATQDLGLVRKTDVILLFDQHP